MSKKQLSQKHQKAINEVCNTLGFSDIGFEIETSTTTSIAVSCKTTLFGSEVDFGAILSTSTKGKLLSLQFEIAAVINVAKGVEELSSLFSDSDSTLELPDGTHDLLNGGIKLNSLIGIISFEDNRGLISLSGAISADFGDNGWSPLSNDSEAIRDIFTLKEVDLSFGWQKGMRINWRVGGEVIVASYQLNAAYLHPHQIISAQLSPTNKTQSSIDSFFADKLNFPSKASSILAGVLTAVDLSIYANIPNQEIEFKVTNAQKWNLIPDYFAVTNMDLRIVWLQKAFNGAELYLDLELPIGPKNEKTKKRENVIIDLEASYTPSDIQPAWHFEAEVTEPIAVGNLIEGLVEKFVATKADIPTAIADMELDDLYFSFDHEGESSRFKFAGNFIFPVTNDKDLDFHIEVIVSKSSGHWTVAFETYVEFSGYQFTINFDNSEGKTFLASYASTNKGFNLGAFIQSVAPDEIDAIIPDDLTLDIENIFVGFHIPDKTGVATEKTEKASILMGIEVDLKLGLDLSEVPMVGAILSDADIGLNSLRVMAATADMTTKGITAFNNLLSKRSIATIDTGEQGTNDHFKKGVYLSANVQVPGFEKGIPLRTEFTAAEKEKTSATATPATASIDSTPPPPTTTTTTTTTSTTTPRAPSAAATKTAAKHGVTPVGTQIGPLFIESIGLGMENGEIGIKFSGGVLMGPLGMEVIELTVKSPLNEFYPSFELQGLTIGLDKPPILIAGALMKNFYKEEGIEVKEYLGGLSIGFKQIAISALGAFAQVHEYNPSTETTEEFKSLFIYGFLSAPLGGPPFLFVTGLALGIGINRGLNIPAPEGFNTFALTAAALKPLGAAMDATDLKNILLDLKQNRRIPPMQGNFWIAVGVRVDTFKILSSFVLLIFKFGHEFEIDILGTTTAQFPAGVERELALVRISIGISARILPERGVLEVKGSFLPDTFIIHKDVHLTGGMAMLAIMKDQHHGEWNGGKAGDFIITLGGYGPYYKPKSYYPQVPKLALDWKVSGLGPISLHIKASVYFAITPEAMMFGGHLLADFNAGSSGVSMAIHFEIGIDFIIYWKPLRYLAHAYAELRASASIKKWFIHITVHLSASADMSLWGPDFAGSANVKVHVIISFHLKVNFGERKKELKPIDWATFTSSFLPSAQEKGKIVSINIGAGIISTDSKEPREIKSVNPKEVSIVLNTQVPIKTTNCKDEQGHAITDTSGWGINPMGIKELTSSFSIEIKKDGKLLSNAEMQELFRFESIKKNIPKALWLPAEAEGQIPKNKDKSSDLLHDVLNGIIIQAHKPKPAEETEISLSELNDILEGEVEDLFLEEFELEETTEFETSLAACFL